MTDIKINCFSALLLYTLLVTGCNTETKRQKNAQDSNNTEHLILEKAARSLLSDIVFDPTSFLLKDLKRGSDENGKIVICGKMNAKNRYGAYVGFQPFVARRLVGEVAEVFMDATQGETYSSPQQIAEAYAYRSKYQDYCASQDTPPTSVKTVTVPSPADKSTVPPVRPGAVAVRLHKGDTCVGSQVFGLNPKGDGFLSVRASPDQRASERFRLYEGNYVYVCDFRGQWFGIVTGAEDSDCGVMAAPEESAPYKGTCRSGWVSRKWIHVPI